MMKVYTSLFWASSDGGFGFIARRPVGFLDSCSYFFLTSAAEKKHLYYFSK